MITQISNKLNLKCVVNLLCLINEAVQFVCDYTMVSYSVNVNAK